MSVLFESLRIVKDHLSEFVDRVEKHHERVVVTRNGRPAAVLISLDDLESLEETLAWLSDPDLAAGRVVTGKELARRRAHTASSTK